MSSNWLSYFPNDNNDLIKSIQLHSQDILAAELFIQPAQRYLSACRLLQVETSYLPIIAGLLADEPIPIHYLHNPYNHIAAYYRKVYDKLAQLPLPLIEGDPYETSLKQKWTWYFFEQVHEISRDDRLARLLIQSVLQIYITVPYTVDQDLSECFHQKYPLS